MEKKLYSSKTARFANESKKKKIINKNTKKKITTKKQTNKKPQTNKQTNTNKNNVHVTINLGGKLMDGRTVECTTLIRDDYLQDDRNIGNFFFLGGGGSIFLPNSTYLSTHIFFHELKR